MLPDPNSLDRLHYPKASSLSGQGASKEKGPLPKTQDESFCGSYPFVESGARRAEMYGLIGASPLEVYDEITSTTADAFGLPIAILSFFGHHREHVKSSCGQVNYLSLPLHLSVAKEVARTEDTLVIEDLAEEKKRDSFPQAQRFGWRQFVAEPVLDGRFCIGALSLVGYQPGLLSQRQLPFLSEMAALTAEHVAKRYFLSEKFASVVKSSGAASPSRSLSCRKKAQKREGKATPLYHYSGDSAFSAQPLGTRPQKAGSQEEQKGQDRGRPQKADDEKSREKPTLKSPPKGHEDSSRPLTPFGVSSNYDSGSQSPERNEPEITDPSMPNVSVAVNREFCSSPGRRSPNGKEEEGSIPRIEKLRTDDVFSPNPLTPVPSKWPSDPSEPTLGKEDRENLDLFS